MIHINFPGLMLRVMSYIASVRADYGMIQRMKHSTMQSASCKLQFAAIFSEEGDTADKVIARVIAQLLREGKLIVGLRQYTSSNTCSDCTSRVLDIETSSTHKLSQAVSERATCSTFNSQALEQTAKTLLARLGDKPDMVTFNRFGQCESDGCGFCCVIERAIELNIPFLTIVHSRWQQNWHDFAPGHMITLPPNYECVLNWCHAAIGTQVPSTRSESDIQGTTFANV